MNILGNKIKLFEEVKRQENEIKQMNAENDKNIKEISDLNERIDKLSKQINDYENKYIHTDFDCEFCYTSLQKEFVFCPKCGKRIIKNQEEIYLENHEELFGTELDRDGLLINQYNGFNEKKIRIPASINGMKVIGIWNSVFEKCTELKEVHFEEGCKYIGKNVFANCDNLKHVHLPKSLMEIGDSAFENCAVEELAIPPNVKVIGAKAFSTRSLKKIILPEGLEYISKGMLSNTSIEEIAIPQSVIHIESTAFSNSMLKEIELPKKLYSIGGFAFSIKGLKKIIIHSNVKIIASNIFGWEENPIIYCAAGSKAQLYARKYGISCIEIPRQPINDAQICADSVVVEFGSYTKGEPLKEWYRHFGFCKAETWSWECTDHFTIHITKMMNMNDALYIKTKIQTFVNSHGDWGKPGIHCSLMKLKIWSSGGTSEV